MKKCKYALFWKGKRIPGMTFKDRQSAQTTKSIECTQMELAEYTPSQIERYFKIKKVCKR